MDAKAFNKKVTSLIAAGDKVRDAVTELAQYAVVQARMANIEPARRLVQSVAQIKGLKTEALTAWLCTASPLYVKKGELFYSKDARKKHTDQDYEIAAAIQQWYEIQSEQKASKILAKLDVQSEYIAFMKRLQKKIQEVQENNGEILHPEFLTKIQQDLAGVGAPAPAVAEPAKF